MNWTALPATPQTDAALRRAAAEQVMGWHRGKRNGGDCWFMADPDGGPSLFAHSDYWRPDQSRDDLARVFVAARELATRTELVCDDSDIFARWDVALTDPRAALASLLDLLGVPVPDGLEEQR